MSVVKKDACQTEYEDPLNGEREEPSQDEDCSSGEAELDKEPERDSEDILRESDEEADRELEEDTRDLENVQKLTAENKEEADEESHSLPS